MTELSRTHTAAAAVCIRAQEREIRLAQSERLARAIADALDLRFSLLCYDSRDELRVIALEIVRRLGGGFDA